jgi:hypothetical protein
MIQMLEMTYSPEDQWHGELNVCAKYGPFSGCSSAWFEAEVIRNFAIGLCEHPSFSAEPVTLEGGYFSDSTSSARLVETRVSIKVATVGARGAILVEVLLKETDHETCQQSVCIRFPVEAEALRRFSSQLNMMLKSGVRPSLMSCEPNSWRA